MVVLTLIIAGSAFIQAKYTKRQARYTRLQAEMSAAAERRLREQSEPQVSISRSIEHATIDRKTNRFLCIAAANASQFGVTITDIFLGLPVPVDGVPAGVSLPVPSSHIQVLKGSDWSECSLPHQLRYGESVRVFYEEDAVVRAMKRFLGHDNPPRILPQCYDSLGNLHEMGRWIGLRDNSISPIPFPDPGPGLVGLSQWIEKHAGRRR